MNTIDLGCGLHFHFINTKFKTAVICILIRSKLTREDATITAIIPSILQNGSGKYKTISEINTAMEELYGSVFELQVIKKGEEQIIQFYIEYVYGTDELAGNTELALNFLYETLLFPLIADGGFSKEYTEMGKQSLKNIIEGRINNKAEYTKLKCIQEMCADEPFGIYADGYIEDLQELDGKKIYEHYLKLLKSAPLEFIFAGSLDSDFCLDKVKSLFVDKLISIGRVSSRLHEERISEAGSIQEPVNVKYLNESMNVSQGKVCMGFRVKVDPLSSEFYDLLLFNELLGGSANSRLFTNIREKKKLCYYINSMAYRFKSIMIIQSGVDSSKIVELTEEVMKIIEELSTPDSSLQNKALEGSDEKFSNEKTLNEKISNMEFENAKKSLSLKYSSIPDNQSLIIEFYFSQYLLGDKNNLETVINKINNVQKSAVEKIASKIKLDTVYSVKGQ